MSKYEGYIWRCGEQCFCEQARVYKDRICVWRGELHSCPDADTSAFIEKELRDAKREFGITDIE